MQDYSKFGFGGKNFEYLVIYTNYYIIFNINIYNYKNTFNEKRY